MAEQPDPGDLQRSIARLLTVGTYVAIALLAVGVGVMLATGESPLEHGAPPSFGTLLGDLVSMRPGGFLMLGMAVIVATPALRVAATLLSYGRTGDRAMAAVSLGILAVIALSVAVAMVTGR